MAKKSGNKSPINTILTTFSIFLILLGLVFIYLGFNDVFNNAKNSNDQIANTDNSSIGGIDVGISTTRAPLITEVVANDSKESAGFKKSIANQEKIKEAGKWIATDYAKGDIQKGEYIVKQGDTLWEIAEAVYGSGFEWTKILDANKGSIGKLPNGEQALIVVGQKLAIY